MDKLPVELQELIIINIINQHFNINNYHIIYLSKFFLNLAINHMKIINNQNYQPYNIKNTHIISSYLCSLCPINYQRVNNPFLFRNPYITNCLHHFLNIQFNFGIIITNTNLEKYILHSIFSNYFKHFGTYSINLINSFDISYSETIDISKLNIKTKSQNLLIINKNKIDKIINNSLFYYDLIFPLFQWNTDFKYIKLLLNFKNKKSTIICINDVIEGIF